MQKTAELRYLPKARKSKFYSSLDPFSTSDPFRKLIDSWLNYCRADGISPQTIYDYSDKVARFYWWWTAYTNYTATLGQHPKYVTTKEAREFASYLREPAASRWGAPADKELSPATIAGYGRTIKVFFSWLEREGHIAQTPFNKSVKFTSSHKRDTTIKTVGAEKLAAIFKLLTVPERLATFSGKRDLAMISLLLDSGIRRGELLSLNLTDLDMGNMRCTIRGKTGQRLAYFSERAKGVLLSYLKLRFEVSGEGPVWLTVDGNVVGENAFGAIIWRLEKASGVKFHAHQLRHTFATQMASQGLNAFTLKDLLGHTSILTTQRYCQINPDILGEIHRPNSPLSVMGNDLPGLQPRGRPRKWK